MQWQSRREGQQEFYQTAAERLGKQKVLQEPKCSETRGIFSLPSKEQNYSCKGPLHLHRPSFVEGFRKALTGMGRGVWGVKQAQGSQARNHLVFHSQYPENSGWL